MEIHRTPLHHILSTHHLIPPFQHRLSRSTHPLTPITINPSLHLTLTSLVQVNELMPVATGAPRDTLSNPQDNTNGFAPGLELGPGGGSVTDRGEDLRWQEIYLQNLGDNQSSSDSGDNPAFPSPFIQTRL